MSTYSIVLRVRRIITEDAYISVPVTNEIMKALPEEDGTFHIDFEAFEKKAIQLSEDASVEWCNEDMVCQVHPIQQPIPEKRTSYLPRG